MWIYHAFKREVNLSRGEGYTVVVPELYSAIWARRWRLARIIWIIFQTDPMNKKVNPMEQTMLEKTNQRKFIKVRI